LIDGAFQFALRVRDSQSPVASEAIFPAAKVQGQSDGNILVLSRSELTPLCVAQGSSLLAGSHYAFLLNGFDADGPVTYSGSVVADIDGNLTGVADILRKSGSVVNQPLTSGSIVQFDAIKRGCMTLNTTSGSLQFRLSALAIDSVTSAISEAQVI